MFAMYTVDNCWRLNYLHSYRKNCGQKIVAGLIFFKIKNQNVDCEKKLVILRSRTRDK